MVAPLLVGERVILFYFILSRDHSFKKGMSSASVSVIRSLNLIPDLLNPNKYPTASINIIVFRKYLKKDRRTGRTGVGVRWSRPLEPKQTLVLIGEQKRVQEEFSGPAVDSTLEGRSRGLKANWAAHVQPLFLFDRAIRPSNYPAIQSRSDSKPLPIYHERFRQHFLGLSLYSRSHSFALRLGWLKMSAEIAAIGVLYAPFLGGTT